MNRDGHDFQNGKRFYEKVSNGHAYTLVEHYQQLTLDGGEDVVWSIFKDGKPITAEKEAAKTKLRVFGRDS